MNQQDNQSGDKPPRNLKTESFNDWAWNPSQPSEALEQLHDSCLKFATDIVDWYNRRKRSKQAFAKLLRTCAIIIAGIGALLLICSQQEDGVSSGWATAALVLAGTLVGLDRFFGFTTAWIRFIETGHEIRILLHVFKLDWEEQKTLWPKAGPSGELTTEAMKLARVFVSSVDRVVAAEINDWATQFRSSVSRHNAKIDSAIDQSKFESEDDIAAGPSSDSKTQTDGPDKQQADR